MQFSFHDILFPHLSLNNQDNQKSFGIYRLDRIFVIPKPHLLLLTKYSFLFLFLLVTTQDKSGRSTSEPSV